MLVEDLRVAGVIATSSFKVVDRILELPHVEVAARTIPKEVNLLGSGIDGFVEVYHSLLVLLLHMVAAAKPVVNGGVIARVGALEVLDRSFDLPGLEL